MPLCVVIVCRACSVSAIMSPRYLQPPMEAAKASTPALLMPSLAIMSCTHENAQSMMGCC